jgi:hypothetical protein
MMAPRYLYHSAFFQELRTCKHYGILCAKQKLYISFKKDWKREELKLMQDLLTQIFLDKVI